MAAPLLATDDKPAQGQDTATKGESTSKDTSTTSEQKQQTEDTGKPASTEKTETSEKPTPEQLKGERNEGAPAEYDLKVPKGLPEGHELDEHVLEEFSGVARELDLSQVKAQKLLDKVLPAIHRRAQEQQNELHDKWIDAAKKDSEIGGAKFDENLATAKKAVQAYGNKELQQLLNGPIGSHPGVLRFLVKVGKTVSEDHFVARSDGVRKAIDPNDDEAAAEKLYGGKSAAR